MGTISIADRSAELPLTFEAPEQVSICRDFAIENLLPLGVAALPAPLFRFGFQQLKMQPLSVSCQGKYSERAT
jgi:hypothetical protein